MGAVNEIEIVRRERKKDESKLKKLKIAVQKAILMFRLSLDDDSSAACVRVQI